MNVKLLAVIFVCAFVASEARPRRGGGQGKGPNSHNDDDNTQQVAPPAVEDREAHKTVKALERLCEGLSSGNITNDNSSFDDVFTSLESVCANLTAYLEAQNATATDPADPVSVPAKRKRSPHGGSRSEESADSDEEDESSEESDSHEPATSVDMLFGICGGVERLLANLPADMAADLVTIFNEMGDVCAAAELVRNPQ